MFCKNCGSQMNENAMFCPNCGWKNTLNEEENKLNGVSNITSKKYFWIATIAVSIIAIVLFVFVIPNFNNDGIENTQSNITVKSDKNFSNGWQGDYYFKNGEKLKNTWVDDYYVGKDGKYVKNNWVGDFYLGGDGKYVKNAWAKYENDWYYCGNDGKIVKNAWVDNQNYYVDASGKMLKNTTTPDGYFVGNDGKYVENIKNNKDSSSKNMKKATNKKKNSNKEVKVSKYIYDKYNALKNINNKGEKREIKIDSDGNLWVKCYSYDKDTATTYSYTIIIYYLNGSIVEYKLDGDYEDGTSIYYKDDKQCNGQEFGVIFDQFGKIEDCSQYITY